MLSKPFLAKCDDRNSMPKSHPTSGAPEDWYSNEMLAHIGQFGISFDFFVNWAVSPPPITPIIWIKRILNSHYTYHDVIDNLQAALLTEFGNDYLRRLSVFAVNYNLQVQFILYRDDYNWANAASELLIVSFSMAPHGAFIFTPEIVSINRFKELIRNYSGGPVRIGQKGLIYSTSRLECHLSHTDSLYPGDADLVMLDNNSIVKGIIEFKKHTLQSSINDQQLSNYYPVPDGRKYNRLAILREFLSTPTNPIPLFVVYYPTNGSFTEGRLELLQGNAGHLTTKCAINFPLPKTHNLNSYQVVINQLFNAITQHYANNVPATLQEQRETDDV